MKRRLALVWMLALGSVGCDTDPTELESPDPTDHSSAGVVQVGENQFAVDFNAYEADQRLWEADWTRIARRWPMGSEPVLGDWRAQDTELSFAGRVAALLDPPLDGDYRIALQWDALPILEPPLEILVQLWLAPLENRPRVGIAWFIQPDENGMLEGYVLERNLPWSSVAGSWLTKLFDYPRGSSVLVAGTREHHAFPAGGWTWIRIRHTTGSVEGTIQYRAWQGSLWDEPAEWWHETVSKRFGPDGGGTKPILSGKAGLFVGSRPEMEGTVPLWGAFTVGINGAPAPPPPGYSKPSLVLECEPERPIRGTEVTCTASTEPQGAELEITGWTFEGGGHTVPAPAGQGAEWGGPMVVSGMVTVKARVDGVDLAATAQVEVDPRDWATVQVAAVSIGHAGLPASPAHPGDLMDQRIYRPESGFPSMYLNGGPNSGWYYVPNELGTIPVKVRVSDAFETWHSWYGKQRPGKHPSGHTYCPKSEIGPFKARGEVHEGLRQGPYPGDPLNYKPTHSHTAVYQRVVQERAAHQAFETAVVHEDDDDLSWRSFEKYVESVFINEVFGPGMTDPRHQHVAGGVEPAPVPCYFRY